MRFTRLFWFGLGLLLPLPLVALVAVWGRAQWVNLLLAVLCIALGIRLEVLPRRRRRQNGVHA